MRGRAPLLVLLLGACRAAPIPPESRYPAGTGLIAKYVTVDGSRIRYVEVGTGPAVLFIHGFGASFYAWRHTLPPVAAAGFRAIAYDNRGFGFSDKPAHGYSNAAYTRLALALLDSLHVSDAVIVGHSMGGAIAAAVALAGPDRVRGLVLMDAAGFGTRWPLALRVARWPLLGALAMALRARSSTAGVLRSTYADPTKLTAQDLDQYYAPVPDPDYGRALRRTLEEFRFDALVGRLGGVIQPTLVIWGAADRWIPPAIGRKMAAELPRAAFVLLPRAGHSAPEEAPEVVNPSLIAFLKQGLPHVPENLAWSLQGWRSSEESVHCINRTVEASPIATQDQ
jgi:pimeloyl-ACP methyl ester carboxylesterase